MNKTEEQLNTPAARLHRFLSKAKLQPDPAQPVRVWANVFDIPVSTKDIKQDELIAVVERLRDLQTLIDTNQNGPRCPARARPSVLRTV